MGDEVGVVGGGVVGGGVGGFGGFVRWEGRREGVFRGVRMHSD